MFVRSKQPGLVLLLAPNHNYQQNQYQIIHLQLSRLGALVGLFEGVRVGMFVGLCEGAGVGGGVGHSTESVNVPTLCR